jgi:hypothetical protein
MPRCGATLNEIVSPLGQGRTSGRFLDTEPTHPGAARHPSEGGDFSKENTMRLNPYLVFNGQCEAAFKFYVQYIDS